MDFTLNANAFLKRLPLAKMTGHEKFLALAALNVAGKAKQETNTAEVQAHWLKSLLGVEYNPTFYPRAQGEGWVDPARGKKGIFSVTQAGLDHLSARGSQSSNASSSEFQRAGGLIVVNRKATHTFDKYLRGVFSAAKASVSIADAWVDETIFDNVLDVTPRTIPIKLLYAQARGTFAARTKRFATQFPQFAVRRYKPLHDRFMVVDDIGYVLGPSIKDAASNSPALVVELDRSAKQLLRTFFDQLWKEGKTS